MQQRLHWAWLVPVLLITTFLGTLLITYDALWFDEWITHFITNTGKIGADPDFFGATPVAQLPICGDFLSHDRHTLLHTLCIAAIDNSWPPLFFILMMGWDLISGGVYFIDRTLALFVGLIGVSLTYRMASTMFDRKTGIVAAALLGTTVFFTFYLHEIRGYTLYATLPALNGWLYWYLLRNPHAGRAYRWGFALSIIGTLYTHYIGLAVVFGIGLYHVLFQRPENILQDLRYEFKLADGTPSEQGHQWISILKLYLNACLTYGLWIGVLYISFINESLNPRSIGTVSLLWSMTRGFSNNLWFISLPAIGLTAVLLRIKAIQFLWVWGLSILGVSIIGNLAADFLFHPRHVMGLMPVFATLAAVGMVYIGTRTQKWITWALVAIWMIAGIYYGISTDFMNRIPLHVDAVPKTAMDTMENTAETCGTETDTFILAWNIPEEEWVQDRIIQYYFYDTDVTAITISRIFDDEGVVLFPSFYLPEDLETGSVDDRYNYFVEDAERVFTFTLPRVSNLPYNDQLADRLEADGFTRCDFINRRDLVGHIYIRDGDQCEAVVSSCGG